MIRCRPECIPCCDFCLHARHGKVVINGITITLGPEGCNRHLDRHHQEIAKLDGYCDSFHCFNMKGVVEFEDLGQK